SPSHPPRRQALLEHRALARRRAAGLGTGSPLTLQAALALDRRQRSADRSCPRRPHLMPTRRKLCTKWRWKSRNAISSGAEVMSVAAQMIDQSIPWSVEAKTCSPTVSGRDSTELVTISGQRKLFQ